MSYVAAIAAIAITISETYRDVQKLRSLKKIAPVFQKTLKIRIAIKCSIGAALVVASIVLL